MEGIAQLKGLSHLRNLYKKGVRHASLTWNEENKFASGLKNLNTRGLTNTGKEILNEMEKLGMLSSELLIYLLNAQSLLLKGFL